MTDVAKRGNSMIVLFQVRIGYEGRVQPVVRKGDRNNLFVETNDRRERKCVGTIRSGYKGGVQPEMVSKGNYVCRLVVVVL